VKVQVVRESTDLPYTISVYGIAEGTFDGSVDEGTRAEPIPAVMLVHSPARRRHKDVYSFLGGLTPLCSDSKEARPSSRQRQRYCPPGHLLQIPVGKAPTGLVRVIGLAVMDIFRKMLIWIALAAVVILAISLPVIVVTGMFGGKPLAGTVALTGLVLLAFGVAWYVRSRGAGI
jgi:hypothetical protein